MNTLNLGTIKAQKVPLPPIEEQIKIAESLYSIDRVRITSEEKKERFNRLKRGLMQDLLTGKVRTTSLDINVLPEVEKYG
jgi:type I restriction enzyme S subunit